MRLGVVMPIGLGRQENVALALDHLMKQTEPVQQIVAVLDGLDVELPPLVDDDRFQILKIKKHQPGMEQPRNEGVRLMRHIRPDVTHVAFLDSDIIVAEDWHRSILDAYECGDEQRIMVCPYEWMPQGNRRIMITLRNDPRHPQFRVTQPDEVFVGDLSAGLACFSGNLVWPINEFVRVGGFWSQIHHGRCEDGELGLRAVAMGVPISFCAAARGWHLWHPENNALKVERNERDVPMLNNRHPWVGGAGVLLVDRDGKAFDVHCSGCDQWVPTIQWWEHATECSVPFELKVDE